MHTAEPSASTHRLLHLDAWRGIAIAGILLVNIYAFGLPYATLNNPYLLAPAKKADAYNWLLTSVLLDGSFRAILSFLFGAGLMLWQEKLPNGQGGQLFFRRMSILLLLGLCHAYLLLWFWDILFMYAVCGMLLFTVRKWPVSRLVCLALLCVFIADLNSNRKLFDNKTAIQLQGRLNSATPNPELPRELNTQLLRAQSEREIMDKTTSFSRLYHQQVQRAWQVQTADFPGFYVWDILVWIILGIIFYKMKWLTGHIPPKLYKGLFMAGVAGVYLCWQRVQPAWQNNFDPIATIEDTRWQYYELARTLRSLGLLGLLIWIWQSGRGKGLWLLFAPLGRLSLSNYLVQSLVCAVLFYYTGFGLFGRLSRMQLLLTALIILALQLMISHWWLKKYGVGFAERLLRK
ncbi:MAG: DUF418 domain-containing protein [Chitinophagaceae bacterium]|nr:DUF418 domain-containing protein [Chitinophagaceae bacterium]